MAEALVIAALVATKVRVANTAKVASSSDVGPLLLRRPGKIAYSTLTNTLVVMVDPDSLDEAADPRAPGVSFDPLALATRCDRYWGIASAVKAARDVQHLLAVLSGVQGSPIVGRWATQPVSKWDAQNGVVRLRDARRWNVGRWRGRSLDWEGRHPQKMQWSNDITV